jgi:hypothetical protein
MLELGGFEMCRFFNVVLTVGLIFLVGPIFAGYSKERQLNDNFIEMGDYEVHGNFSSVSKEQITPCVFSTSEPLPIVVTSTGKLFGHRGCEPEILKVDDINQCKKECEERYKQQNRCIAFGWDNKNKACSFYRFSLFADKKEVASESTYKIHRHKNRSTMFDKENLLEGDDAVNSHSYLLVLFDNSYKDHYNKLNDLYGQVLVQKTPAELFWIYKGIKLGSSKMPKVKKTLRCKKDNPSCVKELKKLVKILSKQKSKELKSKDDYLQFECFNCNHNIFGIKRARLLLKANKENKELYQVAEEAGVKKLFYIETTVDYLRKKLSED